MRCAWGVVAAVVVGPLAACATRTELLVGVVTDLKAPDVLDAVELQISRGDTGAVEDDTTWQITGNPDMVFNLPGSYGVVSDGQDIPIQLSLIGSKGGAKLLVQTSTLTLVDGQAQFYRMGLTAGCIGRDDCLPSQTCVEGACRDQAVDSRQLPAFSADLVTELTCENGITYVQTADDTPMPVAGSAASCPASLCDQGTCLLPPAPAPPASATRTVTVSSFTTYIVPSGTTTVPDDLSAVKLAALVPDGSGGFTTIAGVGSSDGTATIADVPQGTYYLAVPAYNLVSPAKGTVAYYVTASDTFDLSIDTLGSPDPTLADPNR